MPEVQILQPKNPIRKSVIERWKTARCPRHRYGSPLDFGGQKLRNVSPALFDYTFLDTLYLNSNKIRHIPPAIGRLRNLTCLDLSLNEISELPPEIGVLVKLKDLLLFDNRIETLPYEMGSLYQLEMLGIEGNPLNEELKTIVVEHGTSELIQHLRENASGTSALRLIAYVGILRAC